MKILMLLYLKYPDIRVVKEVQSLLKNNHEIYILASNDGNEVEFFKEENLTILRPKEWPGSYVWKGFRYFWSSINFFDKWLFKKANEIVDKYHVDVIHVHDLRLVKTGVKVAEEHHIPIIADLHENYPAAIQAYVADNSIQSVIRRHTVDRYHRWINYEKDILNKVDAIVTVVDEAKKRIIDRYQIDAEKVYVVSNTEDVEAFSSMKIDDNIIKKYENDFMVSYIGSVGMHRGIETVLKAIPLIVQRIPNFRFVIVGGSNNTFDRGLKNLAKQLKIEEYTEFIGRIPFNQVPSYVLASKLGIIPQGASDHTNYTVPHKLFQYMVLGKPVIVSDCLPLKRIVGEGRCGIVFASQDEADLAGKITIDRIEAWGISARKLVEEKYNWANDETQLMQLYMKLGEH